MSWKEVEIEDIVLILRNGASIKQSDNAAGTPITRIETIAKWNINPKRCGYADVTEKDYPNHVLQDGDILISHINSTKHLGKCAIYEGAPKKLIHGMNLLGLRVDPTIAFPKYIYNVLSSEMFRKQLPQITKNSVNQSSFTTTSFKKLKIPLPPLDEQKRIAAILDKADALRRKREKAIALTDDLLRSVFLDMFGDPVTNPNEWECMKLGDLCGVGSSKRVFVSEFIDDGIPFYRGTEVGKLAVGKKITPKLFIAPDHYEDLIQHSGKPEIGDLLLPSICHDGRIWKVDNSKPFYFKDGRVLWIKNNGEKIDSDYLKIHLQYLFLTNYNSIASGTTFAELKIVNLKNLSVLLPPLDLQKKYSKIVEHHSKSIKRLKYAKDSCDDLFASLTQKVFCGDLTEQKEAA